MMDRTFLVMHNPIVLEHIAYNLPAQDLLSLRQTSLLWCTKFTPQLRKKHGPITSNSNIDEFIQLMRSSREIPFGNYSLSELGDSPGDPRQQFKDFVSECGGVITRFAIEAPAAQLLGLGMIREAIFGDAMSGLMDLDLEAHPDDPQDGPGIAEPITYPNLRLLNLRRLQFIGCEQQGRGYAAFIGDMVGASPQLETLGLLWDGDGDEDSSYGFQKAVLSRIRDSGAQLHHLRILHTHELQAPDLEILIHLATTSFLRLKFFSTVIVYNKEQGEPDWQLRTSLLHKFLSIQSPYLENLEIRPQGWAISQTPVLIPRLERLHMLKLDRTSLVEFQGGFGQSCPHLRCLSYRSTTTLKSGLWTYEEEEAFPWTTDLEHLSHPGVTELRLLTLLDNFIVLLPLFPLTQIALLRIRSMNLNHCVQILRTWTQLTRLELDLAIWTDFDTNVFLTGVTAPNLNRLKGELDGLTKEGTPALNGQTLRLALHKYKTEPGVADLGQLQQFSLFTLGSHLSGMQVPRLSEVGVYFGLALAGSGCLQSVGVGGLSGNSASPRAVEFLRSVMRPFATIDLIRRHEVILD